MDLKEQTSGQTQDNSVDTEIETVKKPEAVLAKNRELLAEKKALAQKVAEFEAQARELDLQKKEAEGKKDEVIAALRSENSKLKESNTKKDAAYNWNVVSNQIKEAARTKGCVNPDKFMKLLETDDLNTIEVYDDFSVNNDDLNRVIEKAMKEHSDIGLFKSRVKVDDVVPSNSFSMQKEKPLEDLSKDEILAKLME